MNVIPIITLTDPQSGLQKRHATRCWICHRDAEHVRDLIMSNKIERAEGLAEISASGISYRIRLCPSCVSLLHAATEPNSDSSAT